MGKLVYGPAQVEVCFDDRSLAHLKAVIVAKLRRDESFLLTWDHDADGGASSSIWLHPSIPLRFDFDDGAPTSLNREWIEHLMNSGYSAAGLRLVPEPAS